jgi:hypothetical protein
MSSKCRFLAIIVACLLAACGTMQSIMLTSVPYTTPIMVPASARTGQSLTAMGTAVSFDKVIFKNGNANRINAVKVISAELKSGLPVNFDLGLIQSVKVFMLKPDESEAVLVASKEKIPTDAGNIITLDLNSSAFLDRFIRQPDIRIKMIYTLRNEVKTDANLMLVMKFSATPVNTK